MLNPSTGLRHTKVLLVMDVVESVRLMEQDEEDFVQRWQRLVEQVEALLPDHGGRIVKSLGDGLMVEFGDAAGFSRAALGIQKLNATAGDNPRSAAPAALAYGSATWRSSSPTATTSTDPMST